MSDKAKTQPSEAVGTKLLFENERVRVWDLSLAPGEWVETHVHKLDYCLIIAQGGHLQHANPDDPGDTRDVHFTDDQVSFSEAGEGVVHQRLTNIGATPHKNYIIEFKDAPSATTAE